MKKRIIAALLAAGVIGLVPASWSAGGAELEATTYKIFVHGRSGDSHCIPGQWMPTLNESYWRQDHNNYWSKYVNGQGSPLTGTHPMSNVIFAGFNGGNMGGTYNPAGAYDWGECGALTQLGRALWLGCARWQNNDCIIYTHSTGGLVVARFFNHFQDWPQYWNVRAVRMLSSAQGGNEIADISTGNLWSYNYYQFLPPQLVILANFTLMKVLNTANFGIDWSVSTWGARTGWDHNNSGGLRFDLVSSASGVNPLDLLPEFQPEPILEAVRLIVPGKDDGLLGMHTLCGLNQMAAPNVSCPLGPGPVWNGSGYVHRFTPYTTVAHHEWLNHASTKFAWFPFEGFSLPTSSNGGSSGPSTGGGGSGGRGTVQN